jgi:FkbM family methyltransferase
LKKILSKIEGLHVIVKRIRVKLARLLIENYGLTVEDKPIFEVYLDKLLKNDSFYFIQVGAHDGVRFDNLYQKITAINCAGIVIEPLRKYFNRLKMNYEDYQNVIPLNIALHPNEKEVIIHHVDFDKLSLLPPWSGGIGSIDSKHHNESIIQSKYMAKTKVKAMSFMNLVEKYNVKHIDLLQIDVEGFDLAILKMVDFSKIKPKLIKYEYINLNKEKQEESFRLLKKNGYDVYVGKEDAIGSLNEYFKNL